MVRVINDVKVWVLYTIIVLCKICQIKAILWDLVISAPSMYIFSQNKFYRLHKSKEH